MRAHEAGFFIEPCSRPLAAKRLSQSVSENHERHYYGYECDDVSSLPKPHRDKRNDNAS